MFNNSIFDSTSYYLNPWAVPFFLTMLAIFALGVFVLNRERYSSVSLSFFLMTIPAGVWLLTFSFMYCSKAEAVALWWAKAAYLGVPFIPAAIYYFTVKVLRLYTQHKKMVWASWLASACFSAVIIGTSWMIQRPYQYWWGFYPKYELISVFYLAYFFGMMLVCLNYYRIEYKKPYSKTHQRRVKSLLIAFAVAYLASVDYLPKFGVAVYPFGYVCILVFIVLTARTITRYRLVDITSSFAAEKIIGTMEDALLVLDNENIIRVANDAAAELFYLPKENLMGKHISSITASFSSIGGLDSASNTYEQHYEIEHTLLKSGKKIYLSVARSSMKDALGLPMATILILKDMTQMKEAELALKEHEYQTTEFWEEAPYAIITLDEMGKLKSMNPAAARMLGYGAEDLAGKIFVMSGAVPNHSVQKLLKAVRKVVEGDHEPPLELELLRSDQTALHLELSLFLVKQSQKATAAVQLVFRDMTEERRLQEELKQVQAEVESRMKLRLEELERNNRELKQTIAKYKLAG